jgi:hypothetical protein
MGPGVAEYSVWLQTGLPRFDAQQDAKGFSSSLCVQIRYEAHPSSYLMSTVGPFPGVKRGWGLTLNTHQHLLPRSVMSMSYISPLLWRLHGIAFFYIFTLL